MNVVVSADAERDLVEGIAFYSTSGDSVGDYFRSSILADLQSLVVVGECTKSDSVTSACLPNDFHSRSTILYPMTRSQSLPC